MNVHRIQTNGHENQKQIVKIASDFDELSFKSDEWSSISEANWSNHN